MSLQSLASPLGEPCRVFFFFFLAKTAAYSSTRTSEFSSFAGSCPWTPLPFFSTFLLTYAAWHFKRSPLLQLNQRGHSNTQPRNTNRKNPPLAAHALRATLPVFFLRKEKLGFNRYPVCSSYTKDSGPPPTPYSAADALLFSLEPPALTLLKVLVKHYKKATSEQIPELRDGVGYLEHP